MVVAWVGLRLLRFVTLRRVLDRLAAVPTTAQSLAQPGALDAVRRAITSVARRLPRATCLVQALAADAMLRRRRVASQLRFGVRVRPDADPPFDAHAWVESDAGETIGVGEHESDFELLQ